MTTFPIPGRLAWRTLGGLLPARPGMKTTYGYYRLSTVGETAVGSGWLTRADRSHHAYVVYLGVQGLQRLVGAEPDGWYGPETDGKVRQAQQRLGVEVDGIVGRDTMRALLNKDVTSIATVTGVPVDILGGLIKSESDLDLAAVGVNGSDHGPAQINLLAFPYITVEQALNLDFALHWTGEELKRTHDTWVGRTKADPWDIAIAHHNSPLLAKKWALSGIAPVVPDRPFQIEEYVQKVRSAW